MTQRKTVAKNSSTTVSAAPTMELAEWVLSFAKLSVEELTLSQLHDTVAKMIRMSAGGGTSATIEFSPEIDSMWEEMFRAIDTRTGEVALNIGVQDVGFVVPAAHYAGSRAGVSPGAPVTRRLVVDAQREIREGLAALREGRPWMMARVPSAIGLAQREGQRSLGRAMKAEFRDAFQMAVLDVLLAWWPSTLDCPACRDAFVPRDGRQKYCSPACSQRARWERFTAGKTRDYTTEYRKRRARESGVPLHAKIQGRKQRKG
jgi:hypothetical protein